MHTHAAARVRGGERRALPLLFYRMVYNVFGVLNPDTHTYD